MNCIVYSFATASGLEPAPEAAPWPVLGRQLPRELVGMLNRGGDRGVRFLPLVGVVEGRRRFLEPERALPAAFLRGMHDPPPALIVDGELGAGGLRLRACAGATGDERLALELPLDPADPWPTLARAAFEVAGVLGLGGAPGRAPRLRGEPLARWLVARDQLLVLEADLVQPDLDGVLALGLSAVACAPGSGAARRVLVDLARQLVASGIRDARIAEALCAGLDGAALELVRDGAQVAELAAGVPAALPLWTRVADELPDTDALVRTASGLFQTGRLGDARALLQRAVDGGNPDPELRAQLAAVAELEGEPEVRDRLLADLFARGPDGLPPKVLRLLASWLIDHGRIDAAERVLDALERAAPELAGLWLERGRAHLALGRAEPARRALARCLELRPAPEGRDEARRLLRLCVADGYLEAALEVEAGLAGGDTRRALRTARRLARQHPGFVESWLLLGLARQRAGQLRRAVRAFERGLGIDPKHAEAHHRLGVVLAERGRADRGLTHLQHAVALEPEDAAAWIHLAQVAHHLGQRDESERALRRAERCGGAPAAIAEVRAALEGRA